MDIAFFETIKKLPIELIVIAFLCFVITFILKIPIKKSTFNLPENKRKFINSFIILIPFAFSYGFNTVYYLCFLKQFLWLDILKSSLTACILSISFYAIWNRIKIIINGLKSGNITMENIMDSTEFTELQSLQKNLTNQLQNNKNELISLSATLNNLLKDKAILESFVSCDNQKLNDISCQITNLQNEVNNKNDEVNALHKKLDSVHTLITN